jgi:hypothetical protein
MSPAELNYTTSNQEMLAIIMSCYHWHNYLEGARYSSEDFTDYDNLHEFITTKLLTGWQARLRETLLSYNLI